MSPERMELDGDPGQGVGWQAGTRDGRQVPQQAPGANSVTYNPIASLGPWLLGTVA